jgi:hypothetical protein
MLTNQVVKNIVKKIIKGEDYRIEIVNLINADFLQFVIDFFKKIVDAKLENERMGSQIEKWYEKVFLDEKLPTQEIVINSGLNMKTISNMYGSVKREIAIDAACDHYDSLYSLVDGLIDEQEDLSLTLTIKFNGVSVDLTINETLIVINTLAVKRAALRGGAWSTAGKTVEKVLMKTLCKLYKVPETNFEEKFIRDRALKVSREVDFYLKNDFGSKYLCGVKLMGKGNPESADAIFARKSNIFVADTLSQQNKDQADELGVSWVELRREEGYKRLAKAFDRFYIPYTDYSGNLDQDLDSILNEII